jgi:hypothetical protein
VKVAVAHALGCAAALSLALAGGARGETAAAPGKGVRSGAARWTTSVTAGFDTFVHTYPLAADDTTETVTELNFGASIQGRAAPRSVGDWLVRVEGAAGTELFRERFETYYAWRPVDRIARIRVAGELLGRQYGGTTDYSLNSDNWEGRTELRVAPLANRSWMIDLRAEGAFQDYRTPSTLEQDRRDLRFSAFVSAPPSAETLWRLGLRRLSRSYPDTAEIDCEIVAAELELTTVAAPGEGLHLYHRSDRRRVNDDTVRPSAWSHWGDLTLSVPAGPGELIVSGEDEIWKYDYETPAYFDSWRLRGEIGYRIGDLLTSAWQIGVTGERLDAGSRAETYDQVGVKLELESYGADVNGGVSVEFGRRDYAVAGSASSALTTANSLQPDLYEFTYTDFDYWAIWVLGSWRLSASLALEVMANYQPESHTEKSDDAALGFASVRLVWRR